MTSKVEHIADPVDVTVGARIRFTRKLRKMPQQTLADAAGVSFQQIQKYENGANRVSASMLVRIADTLQVDVAELFGRPGAHALVDDQLAILLANSGALDMLTAYAALTRESRTALVGFMKALQKAS